MNYYTVTINVDGVAHFFNCHADNFGHAEEQAMSAYPSGDVLIIEIAPPDEE